MKIESKYMQVALQKVDDKRKEFSIEFNKEKLAAFQTMLKGIKKEKIYSDESIVMDSDMKVIQEHWLDLMKDVVPSFAKLGDKQKQNINVAEYANVAARYLITNTVSALNGAEISGKGLIDFQKVVNGTVDELNEKKNNYDLSTDIAFNAQRGKDADEVRSEVYELINKASNRSASSMEFGKLYAEWQALTKRQEGHGFFWRAFHRQENADRKELLADMEKALKTRNGGYDVPKDSTPNDIARSEDLHNARNGVGVGFAEMTMNPAQAFGYQEFKTNPDLMIEFNKSRESMKDDLNLLADISENSKNNDLSAPVIENNQQLEKSNNIIK